MAENKTQQLIFLELEKGKILSNQDIAEFCKATSIDPQYSVFIFPGNDGHHTADISLYSSKGGSGLASLAGSLWQISMPTLSLPTVDYNGNTTGAQPVKLDAKFVTSAVKDIWRAIGYGLNIVLPVRKQNNLNYFKKPFKDTQLEPAFWGETYTVSNLELADYYLNQLETIRAFLSVDSDEKEKILQWLKTNFIEAYDAYQDGLKNKTSSSPSAWYTADKKSQTAKAEGTISSNDVHEIDSLPDKSKMPFSSAHFSVSSKNNSQSVAESPNNLAPLSELIRSIISAPDALNINVSQYEELIDALEKMQQVEQAHNKIVRKQATKIALERIVEKSKYWKIARDIFTSIHPNGGYFFDLRFKQGRLLSIEKMNFRTNGKQDRHITPISVIKHLFEEQLQKDMTPDEARKALLSQLETFKSGIEINLRLNKSNKIIVDYLKTLDVTKESKPAEALFNLIAPLYNTEEQNFIRALLTDAFKSPFIVDVVKEEILANLEKFEENIPIHLITNYFQTYDVANDPNPIMSLQKRIGFYYNQGSLKELTKLFDKVLKKPFDPLVAQKEIIEALKENTFGKYDNKKLEAARYVQAIFDYYSHPGTVEDEDHLKDLLKIIAQFYNEKMQLVMSDSFISIPDKTPDRYLMPTLDFGGGIIFYDRTKDKKTQNDTNNSDKEDGNQKEKKDAEGTFINMLNKILTGLDWILLMGTDSSNTYKLEDNLAMKTLGFAGKTITHINKRAEEMKEAIKIDDEMIDLSDSGKMLTSQELQQAIYAIYAMFDYMPLPAGAKDPTDKGIPNPEKHRYENEPKSRLFEVAANHLQFIFAAYPNLRTHYEKDIRKGFLRYLTYGVTEEDLGKIGLGEAVNGHNKQKKNSKNQINIKQFTNANIEGRIYDFANQYTDKKAESKDLFYNEMQQQVEDILKARDHSFVEDINYSPSSPYSPSFDSLILDGGDINDSYDVAAVILYLYYSYDKALEKDFSNLSESLQKILQIGGENFNELFQSKLSTITNAEEMEISDSEEDIDDHEFLPEDLQIFYAIKKAYKNWQPEKHESEISFPPKMKFLARELKKAFNLKANFKNMSGEDGLSSDSEDENVLEEDSDQEALEREKIWKEFLSGIYVFDTEEKLSDKAPKFNISGPRSIVAEVDNNGVFNAISLGVTDLVMVNQLPNTEQRQEFYKFIQNKLKFDTSDISVEENLKIWLKDKSDLEIQQKFSPLLREFISEKISKEYSKNYGYYYSNQLHAAFQSFLLSKLHENITFGSHSFIQAAFEKINKDDGILNKIQAINNWWLKEGSEQYFNNLQSEKYPLDIKSWNSDVEIAALSIELDVSFSFKTSSNEKQFELKGGLIPFNWSDPKHIWLAEWLQERNLGNFNYGHFYLNNFAGINELKQLLGPASSEAIKLLQNFLKTNNIDQPIMRIDENTASISELVQRGILINKDNNDKFYFSTHSIPEINKLLKGYPALISETTAEHLSTLNPDLPIERKPENFQLIDKLIMNGIFGYKGDGKIYLVLPSDQIALRLKGFTKEDLEFIEKSYRPSSQQPIVIERNNKYFTYVRPMAMRKQLEPDIVDEPIIHSKTFSGSWQSTASKKISNERPEAIRTEGDGNCSFNAMALGLADLVRIDQLPDNEQRQPFYTFLQNELNLEVSSVSNQEAFKAWLDDKPNYNIQKSLAPLLRKYAVTVIKEQYSANYQEGYEERLKWAFDLYLQGKSHEDDTFVVHEYIEKQFELLNVKYGELDDEKIEHKEKIKSRESELLDWWRETGKDSYFNALSQPALGAIDTNRWGSEVEPAALAFNLGVGYSWKKFGAEQSLSIGDGLIPIADNLDLLQQLRNRGIGDFYSGYFRINEFASIEDVKQLLGSASEKARENLDAFIKGDIKNPFISTDQDVIDELKQRNIIGLRDNQYYLNSLTDDERNMRLNDISDNAKKLVLDHYQSQTPKISTMNSGGHWTYLRSAEISKKLTLVSLPPAINLSNAVPTKLVDTEKSSTDSNKHSHVPEGLILALKEKIHVVSLNIIHLDNNYQINFKVDMTGKADKLKFIDFLNANDISYSVKPSSVTIDEAQMSLVKSKLSTPSSAPHFSSSIGDEKWIPIAKGAAENSMADSDESEVGKDRTKRKRDVTTQHDETGVEIKHETETNPKKIKQNGSEIIDTDIIQDNSSETVPPATTPSPFGSKGY